MVKELKDVTGNSLRKAFDTISEPSSQKITVEALGPGKGMVVTLLSVNPEAKSLREDVTVQGMYIALAFATLANSPAATLIYTALGRELNYGGSSRPASPEDKEHMAQFLKKVPGMVSAGMIKPNRVKLWEGGLYGINDGLQFMMEGKNSGEKIVYKLQ